MGPFSWLNFLETGAHMAEDDFELCFAATLQIHISFLWSERFNLELQAC